jgi:hypothetical protein
MDYSMISRSLMLTLTKNVGERSEYHGNPGFLARNATTCNMYILQVEIILFSTIHFNSFTILEVYVAVLICCSCPYALLFLFLYSRYSRDFIYLFI